MAYYITAFGGVTFPLIMPITEMPTTPGVQSVGNTIDGGFDAIGADTARPNFPYQIQYRVMVTGINADAYVTAINAIRALGRSKGTLTRKDQGGNSYTCSARCLEVTALDTVETFSVIEVTLLFEIWSQWAKNPTAVVTPLTNSPQNVTATNGGNVIVHDAILTFTAGTHAITALTVTCGSAKWAFSATITAGTALVVDCGKWSVKNNGVAAYQYFAFDAAHALPGVLDLAPGANTIAVASTCAGTRSITVAFSEGWA